MITVLDRSIFKSLSRGTFRDMFKNNETVIVNGINSIIIGKRAVSSCFIIRLMYDVRIKFEIHFKFNSDDTGSLASINMMFLPNTKISDEMTIIRHLGSGSFGDVFHVSVAGKEYALKVGIDIPRGPEQISIIHNEMNIFQLLGQNHKHPNLIQSFPIEFPLGPAILMELGQCTLEDKIKSNTLTFEQTMEIILQILSAVEFLHSIRISHHDLKPDNVLFVDGVPRLFDFGLSYLLETDESFRTHHGGTRGYNHPDPETNYAQDVFSCCFILVEMLIGKKVRSRDSMAPKRILEVSELDIQTILRAKGISEENIEKICRIYRMRTTIEMGYLIKLVESIQ